MPFTFGNKATHNVIAVQEEIRHSQGIFRNLALRKTQEKRIALQLIPYSVLCLSYYKQRYVL